ncbi:MAG: hypothetical protein PHG05_04845 [Candidatus Nanoarchaeia archaeon]|nr:hypothetical protein [Candidatus Nanoarchaeia archaeon]
MNKEFFKGIKEGFNLFGNFIGRIVNFVLLLIIYIIAVGPTFTVSRISKKHFLDIKKNKFKETYWIKKQSGGESIDSFYRQF